MIGTDEFKYELKNVGLNVYGGEEDNDKIMNSDIFRKTVTDPDVEAVVKFIPNKKLYKKILRSLEKMKGLITIN